MPTVTDWSQAPGEAEAAPAPANQQQQQAQPTAGKLKLVNGQLPANEVVVDDATKKVITYRRLEDGRVEKKTAIFKTEVRKAAANKKILERRKWAKFGDSTGLPPGPDSGVTTISDDVYLALKVRAPGAVETQEEPKLKELIPGKGIVQCRICKGGHWTKECPHKNDTALVKAMLPQEDDEALAAEYPKPGLDAKSGVYKAPGRRGEGGERTGDSMAQRDDTATVRVSNISENTREDDLRELFRPFGALQRCFLATDKDTGLARGFAYINFYNKSDAAKAIEKLNGYGYDHLILHVEWAKPQPEKH